MNPTPEPISCDYCGLPVAPAWFGASHAQDEKQYCCYGCRFAAQVTGATGEQGQARGMLLRVGFAIFFAMNVMAFTMVLWTTDVYDPSSETSSQFANILFSIFRYLTMLFAVPVLVLLGEPLLEASLENLGRGVLSTDLLLLAGVLASFVLSSIHVLREDGPVYFEVGCVILILVTLGRWLEATMKHKATETLEALEKLLPATVRRCETEQTVEVALAKVAIGDLIHVLAGERIPCDGTVERHAVHVDEKILTGESEPRTREIGEAVKAGTLNLDGDLFLRVSARPEEGALARLVHIVRQARQSKSEYERLADRVSRVFLPVVMLLALSATVYHGVFTSWDRGILHGMAVMLIACPCALGIATPLTLWQALALAAQHGVLFRHSDDVERLARIDALAFDKTGTLTTGISQVQNVVVATGQSNPELVETACRLAKSSTHVHSRAIASLAPSAMHSVKNERVRTVPGRGLVEGEQSGQPIYLGSARWMRENNLSNDLSANGTGTRVYLGWEGRVRGVFVLSEQARPEAKEALTELRKRGLELTLLTGDLQAHADALGANLGIGVRAELMPEEKWDILKQLREQGKHVAMVGDGINDAPALAASDVGIAMGCGADLARDSAGICLLENNLLRLPWIIDLSRATVRVLRQNLFWTFAYNAVGIGLALAGMLNPVFAAIAMVGSSVFVLTNAVRLRTIVPEATGAKA